MRERLVSVLVRVVPAVVIAGLLASALHGLLENRQLQQHAEARKEAWVAVERENERLVRRIQQLDADALEVERLVADEYGQARPGARLYRFEDDELVRVE